MTGNGFLGKRPKSLSSIFVNPMQIRSNWGLMFKSVNEADFENIDLMITMDWDNRALLEQGSPHHLQHKIQYTPKQLGHLNKIK